MTSTKNTTTADSVPEASQPYVAGTATPFEGGVGSSVAPGTIEEHTLANDGGKLVIEYR